jgi:hypothetical protein
MRLKRVILIGLVLLVLGCGSSFYLNKSYHFDAKPKFSLALVPADQKTPLFDTLMVMAFRDDMPSGQSLITPFDIESKIQNDNELVALLNKIILQDHTKQQLKSAPNLRNLMSEADFQSLQEKMDNADMLIVPIVFGVGSLLNNTMGKMKVRLYDLKDGSLVYEKEESPNVNIGGDAGKAYMAKFLFAIMAASYQENFVSASSLR